MIADQQLRTEVLDTTKSYLVQAPAGSGKTSLLVQRFLSLLSVVEKDPEEVLAITFTRKAAAQMRSRIIQALQLGFQEQAPQDEYHFKLWELARKVLRRDQQLNWDLFYNPARLRIQTIDSLCASITKRLPIITRFGAQPQIESDVENLYARAVDQLLQDLNGKHDWQIAMVTLLQHLQNDRLKLKNLLIKMLAMREQWLPTLMHKLGDNNLNIILERSLGLIVEDALTALISSIPEFFSGEVFLENNPESLDDYLGLANILLTDKDEWRKVLTEKQGFPSPSAAKNKEEKILLKARKDAAMDNIEQLRDCEEFRYNLAALRKLPPVNYSNSQWNIINALLNVLPNLVASLIVTFRDTGKVDFTEVSLSALSALSNNGNPSDLALSLDYKLNHILVDEFQDTSITQYQILEQLTANWQDGDGRTLFLVGDPMQSIYRFRKAEVGLFLKAKQHGISNVRLNFVQLKVNFRSSANVIAWYNKIFAQSFPQFDDMTLGAISYMPAISMDKITDNQQPQQSIKCYAVSDEQEAEKIIQIIEDVRVEDENKSIAILVRAKSHLQRILPALRKAKIEYQGVELETLADRPVIQDLLMLSRALLHLDDRIAWLAILRAPWCGLKLSELNSLAQTETTIWQNLQDLDLEQQPRLSHFKNVIANSLQQLGRKTISAAVKSAWHDLGGINCLKNTEDPREIEAFFELLGDLEHDRDLFNPAYLEQRLQKIYLQPAVLNKNAVQIMTMHKAKGLEFDIVILPGLDKSTRGNDQQLLLLEHRDFERDYLLLAPIKASDEQSDRIYDYLAWCEQQRQELETIRLLYVAITRAREQIFCLADVIDAQPRANSLLAKIWPSINKDFITIDFPQQLAAPGVRTLSRLPDSWYLKQNYNISNLHLTKREPLAWQPDWVRLAGTVLHAAFCNVVKNNDRSLTIETWQQHLRQLGIMQQYLEPALKLIEQAFNNAIHDPIGIKILATEHPESYAEWQLSMVRANETLRVIIDRAFLDQDQVFWIVDYKLVLHEEDLPAAVDKYFKQLSQYATAVRKLRQGLNLRCGLYFPLQKVWHEYRL